MDGTLTIADLALELKADDDPALVLTQGDDRIRIDLRHANAVAAALVEGAAELAGAIVEGDVILAGALGRGWTWPGDLDEGE